MEHIPAKPLKEQAKPKPNTLQQRLDEVLLNAETITQEERELIMETMFSALFNGPTLFRK